MTLKSRILVTGGRDYNKSLIVERAFSILKPHLDKEFCIIQGGATGADKLCAEFAKRYGIPCLQIDANWDVYKKRAGHIRNSWMLQWGLPDLLIAFDGGNGTANMCRQAELQGLDIFYADR